MNQVKIKAFGKAGSGKSVLLRYLNKNLQKLGVATNFNEYEDELNIVLKKENFEHLSYSIVKNKDDLLKIAIETLKSIASYDSSQFADEAANALEEIKKITKYEV